MKSRVLMPLSSVCNLNMGQSPESSSYNQNGDGLPFFQGNADFGELHPKVRYWCNSPTKIAHAGDILISVRAPIGALNIAVEDCCIGRGLAALTAKKGVSNAQYLLYALQSLVDELISRGTGSTFKAISKTILGGTLIPVVDLDVQTEIVEKLDKASKLIALRKKQLEALDLMVKSRFIEMFGDPIANEKSWRTNSLESVCSIIVDCPHSTPNYTNEDTGFMCIRTSIVKKNRILWDEIEYIPENEYYQRIQRKRPEKGDIVYTREGAILGIAAVIDRECNVALGQRSMLLSPHPDYCCSEFLSVAMNFDSFLDKALKGISGSASPHINVGDIKGFEIILPPIEEQRRFANFINKVDKSKFIIQRSVDKLREEDKMRDFYGIMWVKIQRNHVKR